MSYRKASNKRHHHSLSDDFNGSEFPDPQIAVTLKQALVNDIKTLLPGYFEGNKLASASLNDQFKRLKTRIGNRSREVWSNVSLENLEGMYLLSIP